MLEGVASRNNNFKKILSQNNIQHVKGPVYMLISLVAMKDMDWMDP